MLFNKVIGLNLMEKNKKVFQRKAVRAIIINEDKILLIKTNKGDFKFPGGGIKEKEDFTESLLRELTEETGYIDYKVIEKTGVVIENLVDQYEPSAYFQMISHYYSCDLMSNRTIEQKLDTYELELEFTPVWISIDQAISKNEEAMIKQNHNPWIERENTVLKLLLEELNKKEKN